MRQFGDTIDMRGYTGGIGNLSEPTGILSITHDLESGIGKLVQYFGHGSQNQGKAFPVKKTAGEEETGSGWWRRQLMIYGRIDGDGGEYEAFAVKALRNSLEGLRSCACNQRGLGEGAIHQRVIFGEGNEQLAKPFAEASGGAHSVAQMPRRIFAAPDRSKNEGNSQSAHEGRLAKGHESDVVYEIEPSGPMKFSRKTVGANLPEEVIDVQAARPALPAFAPLRQVEIDRLDAKRASRNLLVKRRTVIFAGEDGDVVSLLDESQHPVPADGGLRTFVRL